MCVLGMCRCPPEIRGGILLELKLPPDVGAGN